MNRTPDKQTLERLARLCKRPLDDWLENINRDAVPYRRWLYRVCQEYGINTAVELGVKSARTTCMLAMAVHEAVVGVEIAPDWDIINASLAKLPDPHYKDKVTIIKGDSTAAYTRTQVEQALNSWPIELLFIDSLHRSVQAIMEWELYGPMLASTALVVMDDCKDPPEMADVFWSLPGVQVELDALHTVSGRYGEREASVGFGAVIICH